MTFFISHKQKKSVYSVACDESLLINNIEQIKIAYSKLSLATHNNYYLSKPDNLEHVYMISEMNSNRFEISNRFEMSFCLHGDFTAPSFQIVARLYCTCANDIF